MMRWYIEKELVLGYDSRWDEWIEGYVNKSPVLQYKVGNTWINVPLEEKVIDKREQVLDSEKSGGEMSKMPEYPRTTTYVDEPLGQMDLFGLLA